MGYSPQSHKESDTTEMTENARMHFTGEHFVKTQKLYCKRDK